MSDYLRCPMPRCTHHVHVDKTKTPAEDLTDHLIGTHGLPEVSASYQAHLMRPITGPKAA